ncbi:MAG TPA: 30S ribosomal protein S17 [Candidatus Polarisedimenticolaceae bacterium]|nr:30S ribosomal protein S17 [Candidatus Polarisedimenticolaceae bacterium]
MNEASPAAVRRRKATKIGVVTSNKMDKSVVVRVERTVLHDRYKKHVQRSARFMAHDERNECKIGDTVEIVESRPLSARKRWRVRRIVRPADTDWTAAE